MPAPGEQHLNSGGRTIINPFEEVKPRISEYTAKEIATLQSKLEKQLGPEYISSRQGPSGGKVHYVAAEKCIQLANEVFGFNGWSSQIKEVQVDFVDEHPQTLKVSLGLSVIVRVTLRDGSFHEDIGYGHIENCKGKAAAFEKAKKEGTTDGLKRALRNFGNVLGNCIYDKEYLAKVTKIKVQPGKWDVSNLHRHADHTIKKEPEKEQEAPKFLEDKSRNIGAGTSISTEDTLEDEFGDFDEADFSVPDPDAHPDEVVLPGPSGPSHHLGGRNINTSIDVTSNQNRPLANRQQPMRPQNVAQPGNSTGGTPLQPQTPSNGLTRSTSGAGQMRPPQDTGPSRPAQSADPAKFIVGGKVLNQPSRAGLLYAPVSPARLDNTSSADSDNALPPPGAGFFSAKAASRLVDGSIGSIGDTLPPQALNLPAFNPHADSPSIRKTPGIDHSSTKPLTRDLKHVPGSTQAVAEPSANGMRANVVNPQFNTARRIGAPASGNPSPMANRGSYKPPTIKRPVEGGGGRVPLVDLPANGTVIHGDGGDIKRQKLNG